MLAKRIVKNQITLPKAVVSRFKGIEYFEVEAKEDAIVLLGPPFRAGNCWSGGRWYLDMIESRQRLAGLAKEANG